MARSAFSSFFVCLRRYCGFFFPTPRVCFFVFVVCRRLVAFLSRFLSPCQVYLSSRFFPKESWPLDLFVGSAKKKLLRSEIRRDVGFTQEGVVDCMVWYSALRGLRFAVGRVLRRWELVFAQERYRGWTVRSLKARLFLLFSDVDETARRLIDTKFR